MILASMVSRRRYNPLDLESRGQGRQNPELLFEPPKIFATRPLQRVRKNDT